MSKDSDDDYVLFSDFEAEIKKEVRRAEKAEHERDELIKNRGH